MTATDQAEAAKPPGPFLRFLIRILDSGCTDECGEDERTARRVFTGGSLFVGVTAPLWGVLYIANGELLAGLIPSTYSVVTLASLVVLNRRGGWAWFRPSQTILIFVLPFTLMWSLGGFVPGSAVMIWALLAPLSSLWGGRSREALVWIFLFMACAVVSGLLEPVLRDSNDLPAGLRTSLFVLNVTFVPGVVFLLLDFFVGQKDTLLDVMRRNRELETVYLQQEVSLRQSDKLATIGRLSAGLAHELNNPAAAVQQATSQLAALLESDDPIEGRADDLDLLPEETDAVRRWTAKVGAHMSHPEFIDPLERSDREESIADELDAAGVADSWDLAPSLVGLGLRLDDVQVLVSEVRHERLGPVVAAMADDFQRRSLIGSLSESTNRIVAMVRALKSYTHLDQTPRQLIDVHEGIESTLVMLQNRLKPGIEVTREFSPTVTSIEAWPGELNQVWTNIIDNAIDAMDGVGTITIATLAGEDHVEVRLTDSGPGISESIAGQIFDPFVTTKPPGVGTGLGLNISHSIITQKHGGEITVDSEPGRTTFLVRLPVSGPASPSDSTSPPYPEPDPITPMRET